MLALDIVLLALLSGALVFSIIELGLSAYTVSLHWYSAYSTYDPNYAGTGYGGYDYGYRRGNPPGEVSFLLFDSLWTVLVCAFLIGFLLLKRRNHSAISSNSANKWLTPLTLTLTILTMIFWLAGFASLAHRYNGADVTNIAAALLAFSILLWLIFLALVVLNTLTAFKVLKSELLGWTPVAKIERRRNTAATSAPMTEA